MRCRWLDIQTQSQRKWLAVAMVLLGFSLRTLWFQDVPPGLVRDEVLNADIVEFIRAGRHALFFREGFGHEPLYHYFSVPFQVLLGDNALAIRFPSIVLGTLMIALSIPFGARWGGRSAGLWMALGLAISWWPIIFSRIGLRAIMLPVFLMMSVYEWDKGRPIRSGLWLGLSMYTYTAARVMLGWPVLLLIDALFSRRPIRDSLLTGAIAGALYLPLQLVLWFDPALQERVGQLSDVTDAALVGNFGPLLLNIRRSMGVFTFTGDPLWSYAIAGDPLFGWWVGSLFYIGILIWVIRGREAKYRALVYWLGLGMVPTIVTPDAPSLIRLIGIIPVVFLAIGVGAAALIRADRQRAWLGGQGALILILAGFLAHGYSNWVDGFQIWTKATPTVEKYGPIWRDIAADIEAHQEASIVILDSWVDPIDHDRVVRSIGERLPIRWAAVDQSVTSGAIVFPANSAETRLYVPEFAGLNGTLAEIAGLGEPISRSTAWPTYAVYELPVAPTLESLQSTAGEAARFNETLHLIGTELALFQGEGRLEVYTMWRVDEPLQADLAFFVHMLDRETGELLAQHDGFDAFYPQIEPGDRILQRHLIWLPAEFDPAAVELRLGVYERESGNRWLLDQSGLDTVPLGPFPVE